MVRHHKEVVASLGEEPGLLETPCDGEGFTFDGRIAGFRARQEAGTSQDDAPAIGAAVGSLGRTCALLLGEEVANTMDGSVWAKASSPGDVKNLYPFSYGINDGEFRSFESLIQFR